MNKNILDKYKLEQNVQLLSAVNKRSSDNTHLMDCVFVKSDNFLTRRIIPRSEFDYLICILICIQNLN